MYTLNIYGRKKPKSGEFIALFYDLEELIVTGLQLCRGDQYFRVFDVYGWEVKWKND